MTRLLRLLLPVFALLAPLLARAQTLVINNDVQTVATLTSTTATLTGKAELHITGTGDPMVGCVINLNSADAWFYMENIKPSVVVSTFMGRIFVNGAAAVNGTNVRVVQHELGAVVIPHGPGFSPLEVFDGKYFTGTSKALYQYVTYDDLRLGGMKTAISSFKLKCGYMATFAQEENGTGISKVYVAQDGDLEVGQLPTTLDNSIRFVRIFPWRWTSKKGFAGNIWQNLKPAWYYNWNLDQNSSLDVEYVAIRQSQYWPDLNQDWKARGTNHLLGYNEPDHTDQANMTVAAAIAGWPELLATGLRLGAPAVSDGGLSWLYSFMDAADAANLRVDYVPVHYYRSYSNAANAAGAATQFYNFLKGIHDTVQRPLWVTEWNNGANWTTDPDPTAAQQQATVAAMIDMLDNTPWVERYSIYNWVEDVRRVVWDDGSTTAAGDTYRDNASPIAVLQEMADAGSGNSARYPFDGDGHDAWGNGQDAMFVGSPIYVAGKYGQALQFDGTTDYVQLSPRLADTTDFTFAGWVYWNGGANWQRIFDFGTGTDSYVCLTTKSSAGFPRFIIKINGTEQVINGTAAFPTGVWTHVAATVSGDTGKLFINGAVVATNAAMTFNTVDVGTKFNYLGKSQWPDPLFSGKLDDIRFVSSAMTDAQILAIYTSGPPQFSATTLLKASATTRQPYTSSVAADATGGSGTRTFSKMSGPAWLAVALDGVLTGVPRASDVGLNHFLVRVTDANGSIHTSSLQIPVADANGLIARYAFDGTATAAAGTANGTTTGSPAYATGKYGSAIDLDGADDFVTLPRDTATLDTVTIATWINWDGGNQWQRIFDFGNGAGEYLMLTAKSPSNTMRFAIQNNGTEQRLTGTMPTVGAWVHVAVTLGGNIGKMYINGALVDTQTITYKPSDFAPATLYIGKSQFAADPLFNGRIDEFQIFNTALSAAQISAIYAGRAPLFASDPISKPSITAGSPYNQSLALNASDPDAASTLTFSKVSGPAWLTVAADGRISGQPAANDVGANRFIVRVTDQAGIADDAVMNISIVASSGLVGHYLFDGNTMNTVTGIAGTAAGSPVYSPGVFDSALEFDGVNDVVTLPANITSTLTDTTFALRVRWDGGAAWQRIFDFGSGGSSYMMLTASNGTNPQFGIANAGTSQALTSTVALPVGEWTHVAVTLVGTTGKFYVNGALVATATISLDPANITQTTNYLGDSQFTADPFFNGALDDFRIYNRGLSAAEVAALAVPPAPIAVALDYTGWTTGLTFPGSQTGAAFDPDNDGVANGYEFLLGLNPATANAAALPAAQVRTGAQLGIAGDPAKTYLTFQIRLRKQRPYITLYPEAATTLAGLATAVPGDVLQAGTPVSDGEFEIITYYYKYATSDVPGAYFRLRVVFP